MREDAPVDLLNPLDCVVCIFLETFLVMTLRILGYGIGLGEKLIVPWEGIHALQTLSHTLTEKQWRCVLIVFSGSGHLKTGQRWWGV